jgi:hypothetical protein
MEAIQPGLTNLLTVTGIASTADGQAAIKAYNAALVAVQGWTPGTTAQNVIQVIDAFTAVFNTLPFPTEVQTLVDIVSAGIVTVIGVLTANSPAPVNAAASTEPQATAEETHALHQAAVIESTTAQVQKLVPSFKRSIFTSPAHQYKNTWNGGVQKVAAVNPKYAVLKV